MEQSQQAKWLIRMAILLLIFLCMFIFLKLTPIWKPIFQLLLTIFIPLFIAGFITYLLHPIVDGLHQQGIPRTIAILSIYFLFFGSIAYGLYKLIPPMVKQLQELSENLPQLINMYRSWIQEIDFRTEHFPEEIHARIEQALVAIEQAIHSFITNIFELFKKIFNSLILFILIPFLVFYMLKDIALFKKAIWYMTPRKWRKEGIALIKDIDESLGNYIRGQLFVCFLIGSMATIFLWIGGMSYPLLLGVIIGITNIIPYFGPIIGAIPALIVASTISVKMIIIVVVIIFGLQIIEGNILSPLIVGKSLQMHPVIIMLALLAGEKLAGVLGLIVAVPIVAILRVFLSHLKANLDERTKIISD